MIPASHQLSLKLIEKCPSCQSAIPVKNIHIIDETEMNMVAHVSCSHCLSKYFTYISHHPHGLVGNAVLTDLTYYEAILFMQEERLSEDDVLYLYQRVHTSDFISRIARSSK